MSRGFLTVIDGGVELDVQVVPRASKNRVAGLVGDRLKIQLNAPPVDGEANAALLELLAEALGCKKAQLAIVAGATSKKKRVRADGVSEASALELLS